MAKGIKIIEEGWDVFIDDDWSVVRLTPGQVEPLGATVFRVVPVPQEQYTRLGLAYGDPSLRDLPGAIAAIAAACVVGWRGMTDGQGAQVAYSRAIVESGRIPAAALSALARFAVERTAAAVELDREAGPKNAPSGSGPAATPSSGTTTTDRRRATPAPRSTRKQE